MMSTSALSITIPELTERQIEREAFSLLADYGEKFGVVTKSPVPIDRIVELHLQLRLEFKDMKSLFPCADVVGAIWFREGVIGIDRSLDPETQQHLLGRYHFTLAHEVGHWQLHRPYYLEQRDEERLLREADSEQRPDVICRSGHRRPPVELQADIFAANLLMPKRLILAAWEQFRRGISRIVSMNDLRQQYLDQPLYHRDELATTEETREKAMREAFCAPLAEQFEVSSEAMRIRLEDMKLIVGCEAAA